MNPLLSTLQPYPFERLRNLLDGISPKTNQAINLSVGEPKHATPRFILEAMTQHLDGLSHYPSTLGLPKLRETIVQWLTQRYNIPLMSADTQILPVSGTREALFSFAQVVLDHANPGLVLSPNPFYQIYEGAALLGGSKLAFYQADPNKNGHVDWLGIATETLKETQLLYVCSPNNPNGAVLSLDEWKHIFELSDTYDFVIAADECYSEIYFDESAPPLGALQAAHQLGRHDYKNLVVFSSLSKRSNVPGLRSGFVAGDAALIKPFLHYRTYHGTAMSNSVAMASIAAWSDEEHVRENRALYTQKFTACAPILEQALDITMPEAGFYFWVKTPCDDQSFSQKLYQDTGITVLPGSFLGREVNGHNPGANYIRIAMVDSPEACLNASKQMVEFVKNFSN